MIGIAVLVLAVVIGVMLVVDTPAEEPAGSSDGPKGYGMGGVDQDVALLAESIENEPEPWDLSTPESAVRSYLDWVSYAYRTTESEVASLTQSPYQLVRTDAYIQSNLQQERLLDQSLVSITFGEVVIDGETATLPAKEEWTYRYVSIVEAGKTLQGPLTASYETTYTLVKGELGWVVDNIDVTTIGEVQ